jgi:hypothetical protein
MNHHTEVLSDQHFQQASGAIILMMATSAVRSRWDSDIELDDWKDAGLRKASILRFKIFTLDEQLVGSRRGALSDQDWQKVRKSLKNILACWA